MPTIQDLPDELLEMIVRMALPTSDDVSIENIEEKIEALLKIGLVSRRFRQPVELIKEEIFKKLNQNYLPWLPCPTKNYVKQFLHDLKNAQKVPFVVPTPTNQSDIPVPAYYKTSSSNISHNGDPELYTAFLRLFAAAHNGEKEQLLEQLRTIQALYQAKGVTFTALVPLLRCSFNGKSILDTLYEKRHQAILDELYEDSAKNLTAVILYNQIDELRRRLDELEADEEIATEDKEKDKEEYFLRALEFGNLTILDFFINEKGVDVNSELVQGHLTPLIAAARFDQIRVIRYLLDQGADINLKSRYNRTALNEAARMNNTDVIKALLENPNSDINHPMIATRNATGPFADAIAVRDLPLVIAAESGHFDCIAPLLAHQPSELSLSHALKELMFKGFGRIRSPEPVTPMLMLLEQGARFLRDRATIQTYLSNDPHHRLHHAAQLGYVHAAQTLLEGGALFNKNDLGQSPLHVAVQAHQYDMIAFLLLAKDVDGNTCEIHQADSQGNTPLMLAEQLDDQEAIRLLTNQRAPHFDEAPQKQEILKGPVIVNLDEAITKIKNSNTSEALRSATIAALRSYLTIRGGEADLHKPRRVLSKLFDAPKTYAKQNKASVAKACEALIHTQLHKLDAHQVHQHLRGKTNLTEKQIDSIMHDGRLGKIIATHNRHVLLQSNSPRKTL